MSDPSSKNPGPIADHELLHPIGCGSAGVVWLARTLTGQFRALKLIDPNAAHAGAEFGGLENYEPRSREHPALMNILQAGRHEGSLYYIMDLADPLTGTSPINPETYQPKTLASELERTGPQPVTRCAAIGESLARGLNHLHRHGLVHRDIKPSNILFINDQPVLGDPGLVARPDEPAPPGGTLGYIPPEGGGQPPADIFALGKVLYEALTGRDRTAFPSLPAELLRGPERRHVHRLNNIILQACHHEAGERYPSAEAMGEDLKSSIRTRRPLAWAGVGLLLCTAMAAGIHHWKNDPPSTNQKQNKKAPATEPALVIHSILFGAPCLAILNDSNGTRHIGADITHLGGGMNAHAGLVLGLGKGLRPAPDGIHYIDAPGIVARYLAPDVFGQPAVELLDTLHRPPWKPIARAKAPAFVEDETYRMELEWKPAATPDSAPMAIVRINGKVVLEHPWPMGAYMIKGDYANNPHTRRFLGANAQWVRRGMGKPTTTTRDTWTYRVGPYNINHFSRTYNESITFKILRNTVISVKLH